MSDDKKFVGLVITWALFWYTAGLTVAHANDNRELALILTNIGIGGLLTALTWLILWLVDTFEIRKRGKS
jgi:hypothetical protein